MTVRFKDSSHKTNDPAQDPWINFVIDSRYRIQEKIGRGGMGTVYKIVHTQIGKIAALKLLHGNLASDRELIKRFHREAEAISRLNHPNIVQVFDFGRVQDTIYLVMEYLKGEDLSAILHRDGPINIVRCVGILIQVCDALSEAHDLGIVHRDLKPENVRISRTRDGNDFVKVMDFGLAKMLEEEDQQGDHSITARGNLVGTPYYMAPELIRAQQLDHRCDIYSLGAMFYRMLTGQNAFMANTPVGVLTKHITDDLTLPSVRAPDRGISAEVDTIVCKAMAKDRMIRYQSASDMKHDLIEVLGQPLNTTPSHGLWKTPPNSQVLSPHRRETDPMGNMTLSQRTELGELPTGRIEEHEITIDPVLSKKDLAFERRLKRSRLIKPLLIIPFLGVIGLAVYWFGMRQVENIAPPKEVEPNNSPDKATTLAIARPILGHLGQRHSSTESDRDWFRFKVEGTGPQLIQAKLSGISNMDVTIDLYDGTAGRITGVDSAGKGAGEIIPNWSVDPGFYYLLVREVWKVGVPPTENVTDGYRLRVSKQEYTPEWEMEPNDQPKQASEIKAGSTLRGYLGTVEDRDCILIKSGPGKIAGMVSGISGVNLVIKITPSGSSRLTVIDDEATSTGERFDGVVASGTQPVLIEIGRKNTKKGTALHPAVGLDLPYTLKVWLQP